jgi:P2 family phage contractile tail tube protein
MLPRIVKNFAVFIDGRAYNGRAEEMELPKLTIKTEEHRAGGMDAPVEIDMGMEKLECKVTLTDYDSDVVRLLGLYNAGTQIVLRGAIQRQGEPVVPVEIRMRGGVKELDRGSWKAGDKATQAIAIAINSYTEKVDGEVLVDIDVENMIRVIGGVDQLAEVRSALGI